MGHLFSYWRSSERPRMRTQILVVVLLLLSSLAIAQRTEAATSPPRASKAPKLVGSPRVGERIAVTKGTWRPRATSYGYQWQVLGKNKKWSTIRRQTKSTFTPSSKYSGKKIRACVRTRAGRGANKSRWSLWSCSRTSRSVAKEVPVVALSITYSQSTFLEGQDSQTIAPTVTGGSGNLTYSFQGTLPDGVSFDANTGAFIGPDESQWKFRATQIVAGDRFTCALTVPGGVKCWGDGTSGRLGTGDTVSSDTPRDVVTSAVDRSPITGVIELSAGVSHTCAVLVDGSARCWGVGTFGRLGNGLTTNQSAPSIVLATGESAGGLPLADVASISAGAFHSCAILRNGRTKCWGDNASGQLGDGTTVNSNSPVDVRSNLEGGGSLSGIVRLVTGEFHSCALSASRRVLCWGSNGDGQLGIGSTIDRLFPTQVLALESSDGDGVIDIAAGYSHTCAVMSSNEVSCWGFNGDGQLGDGTRIDSSMPVKTRTSSSDATPLSIVVKIAAGQNGTCAVTTNGEVKCWGRGSSGELGDGLSSSNQTSPTDVVGFGGVGRLSGARDISGGGLHNCAVVESGAVACWGQNTIGQLGVGDNDSRSIPTRTSGAGPHADFQVTGTVRVSDGSRSSDTSVAISLVSGAKVRYGRSNFVAFRDRQTLTPIVDDGSGQASYSFSGTLPAGVAFDAATGVFTGPPSNAWRTRVAQISAGSDHSCVVTATSTVKCWGNNTFGQLGNNSFTSSAVPVDVMTSAADSTPLSGVVQVSAGYGHTCAVMSSGGVKCWGWNGSNPVYGQLGDNTTTSSYTPVDVVTSAADSTPLSGALQVSAGFRHTCALMNTGGVKCWGGNGAGQLGNNSTTSVLAPVDVVTSSADSTPLSGVAQVSIGDSHSCAVLESGDLKCWGNNNNSKIGIGGVTNQLAPVSPHTSSSNSNGLSGVIQVVSGGEHTCALMRVGTVKCWGKDTDGQIGIGTNVGGTTPVPVEKPVDVHQAANNTAPLEGVVQLSAGSEHTCALLDSGALTCWGKNDSFGRLGSGGTHTMSSPTFVVAMGEQSGGVPLSAVAAVAAGRSHSCVVTSSGALMCWGSAFYGQLGDGRISDGMVDPFSLAPVETAPLVFGSLNGFPFTGTVTRRDSLGTITTPVMVFDTW